MSFTPKLNIETWFVKTRMNSAMVSTMQPSNKLPTADYRQLLALEAQQTLWDILMNLENKLITYPEFRQRLGTQEELVA